jgi:transglutaminase/protease-like cytokinesis protein 3
MMGAPAVKRGDCNACGITCNYIIDFAETVQNDADLNARIP